MSPCTAASLDDGDVGQCESRRLGALASPAVGGPFVPVFRVASLDTELARLLGRGVEARHKPLDIGEGKRVVTFSDPDGNGFRLIEIAQG